MKFAQTMKERATKLQKRVVLPEGCDARVVVAARQIVDEKIASKVTLLGTPSEVTKRAQEAGIALDAIEIIDPATSPLREAYAQEYYTLRKHKGMSEEEAYEAMGDPLRYGAMMVRLGDSDAMVAGAENTTGSVLLAAFHIIKTKVGIKSASSCFVMATAMEEMGVNGSFIFSDCATIVDPTAEQLVEIAEGSALSCQTFLGVEPVIAFLSYSSKGSAKGPMVDKVTTAVQMLKEKRSDLIVDGELQLDAAIVESVGKSKAPDSPVAGKANVLIFPDLQAGNIGINWCRLRELKPMAYLTGFAKPVATSPRL